MSDDDFFIFKSDLLHAICFIPNNKPLNLDDIITLCIKLRH